MPELPEVETCRKGLIANNILNKEIAEVRILQTKLREEIPSDLPTLLKNQQFTNIYRRAKYLIFATTNGGCVISHLGMTGQWIFLPSENATNNANSNANFVNLQHKQLQIIFADNSQLVYNDSRKFGLLTWSDGDFQTVCQNNKWLKNLGVEPFDSQNFTQDYFYKCCLSSKKRAIKPFLMDTQFVVGIGNIYAAESLFLAKISPFRLTCTLSKKESNALHEAILITLQKALDAGGSSLKDYKHVDGSLGHFQLQTAVYGRDGQACKICGTTILKEIQNQRSTFYCPNCQK